jgi:hypothetical protein
VAKWLASISFRMARSSSRRTSGLPPSTFAILPLRIKQICVPEDFLLGRVVAKNIVDTDTGEVVANANDEITETLLAKLREAGIIRTLKRCTPTNWIAVPSFPIPCAQMKPQHARRLVLPSIA